MTYQNLVAKTWRSNILFSVMLELTYRCNLDCFFCYNELSQQGVPLSLEQYRRLLEELADLRVMNLTLTGGEPLAHPDFFAIGARARELGFVVRVKSNGHTLRGAVARRLKEEVDPFVVEISLHGACAETHDRQTRVPGSFARLMENLPELRGLGLRLKLNATMTCWNEDEAERMLELAESLGVPLAINPSVSPRDDGDQAPLSIAPSLEGKRRLFRLLSERHQRQAGEARPAAQLETNRQGSLGGPVPLDKNCGAASAALTIDPYGNVLPCVQWRRPVGNLHERTIREIWLGSKGLEEVRELTAAAKRMVDGHGPARKLMAFCPALAEAVSGDPLRVYNDARERMELLAETQAGSADDAADSSP